MKNSVLLMIVVFQTIFASAQTKKFLIPYRDGNHWGFCDTLARPVIQPKYDSTAFFDVYVTISTVSGKVISSKKEGIISFNGKLIVPIQFDNIVGLSQYYLVYKKNRQGLYNASGRLVVPVQYDHIYPGDYGFDYFKLVQGEKQGLYFPSLRQTIPAVYDFIASEFYSEKTDNVQWFYARKGKEKFLINKKTANIIPYKEEEDLEFSEGIVAPAPIEELMMEDTEKEDMKKIREQYAADAVVPYTNSENDYVLTTKLYKLKREGKTGLAFANALILLSPVYDSVSYVMSVGNSNYLKKRSSYLIAAKKGNYFGLINEAGDEILPFQYDMVTSLTGYPYAFQTVLHQRKGVFLPYTFYPPIQPLYDDIRYFASLAVSKQWSFSIFKVIKNGKPGFIGENGRTYFKN